MKKANSRRYASHVLKTTNGTEITKREDVEAILENIYRGLGAFSINGKIFEVVEDRIIDGSRTSILKEKR